VAVAAAAVVEAAVSEAAVFAAVAGVGVVAEVGAAASASEAEVATSATAGVATSARIDLIAARSACSSRAIRTENNKNQVRRSDPAHLIFERLRINSNRFAATISQRHRRARLTCIDLPTPCGSRRLPRQQAQKQNPAGFEPTGFSRKDDRRRVLARWPVKDLLSD
jgi:hypothetical protein